MNDRPVADATRDQRRSGPWQRALMEPRIIGWIVVAVVLIGWELAVLAANLNPIYLPRPTRIVLALAEMFRSGGLTVDLLATLGRIFGGFSVALVIGQAG